MFMLSKTKLFFLNLKYKYQFSRASKELVFYRILSNHYFKMSETIGSNSPINDSSCSDNEIIKKRKTFSQSSASADLEQSSNQLVDINQSYQIKSFNLENYRHDDSQKFNETTDQSTPSRKRTHSISEDYFPEFSKPSPKNVSNRTPVRGRRSLPVEQRPILSRGTPDRQTLSDNSTRRKSFPLQITPQISSHYSIQRSCSTDQTPYSPVSYQKPKRFRSALPYYNPSDLITFQSDEGFIDSHCHIDFLFQRQGYGGSFSDYQERHKDTFPDCYKGCLAIFCNPDSFNKKYLWESYLKEDNIWASFGCHPHNAKDYTDEVEISLKLALEHPKVRALGEIGLDYSNRNNCLRTLQHEVFRRQLKIAIQKKLPLVIHCREAHDDGMAIMKEMVPKDYSIHLHCFTDTWELASKWLDEFPNLFIGITNVVTFPSAETVHEVARRIPLTRLLLETDAPYFIPRPLQREYPGTRLSHPGMAIHVAAQIAALKGGIPLELVLHCTRKNTKKMYKI